MEKDTVLLEDIFKTGQELILLSYLNAFYSALILQKQSGVQLTTEVERYTLSQVFSKRPWIEEEYRKFFQKFQGDLL